MPRIAVFLNPHALKNRGRTPDRHRGLALGVGSAGTVYVTASLVELAGAVRDALDRGARYFVADGGDGSLGCLIHELRSELRRRGADPDQLPPLSPTRSGTIDFVARKVGIRGGTELILRRLARAVRAGREPRTVSLPSLRVTGSCVAADDGQEATFDRLAFALAAGGIGQRFFDKYYRERPGPGAILRVVGKAVGSFALARGRALDGVPEGWRGYGADVFRPTRARVTIDGEPVPAEVHGAIHAGAFAVSLGGIFRVFPLAQRPGQIHFQAGEITPGEMITSLPRLVRGAAIASARLVEVAGTEMVVEAVGDELLHPILDGEDLPRVVRLRVTPGPGVPILDLSSPGAG